MIHWSCPALLPLLPKDLKYGTHTIVIGAQLSAGDMFEIQSVMRTRACRQALGLRPRAVLPGLNQRYCPGEHD